MLIAATDRKELTLNGLKMLRKRAGLSQQQLADASGFDLSGVSRAERGHRTVTLGKASMLLDVLHAHLGGDRVALAHELVRGEEDAAV